MTAALVEPIVRNRAPMAVAPRFDYQVAFCRNLGFVSPEQQERLRGSRVAIAGLGGTGGAQAHALARMGIGAFSLADPDTFELANFNRQSGALVETIGRRKSHVIRDQVGSINPDAKVRLFDDGIHAGNIDAFLHGADVVVDSLDFYCFDARRLLYHAARERGLWVITAPPLGFGFTLLVFDPKGMSFEDYFDFRPGMTERQRLAAFVVGLAPRPYMLAYLDRSVISTSERRLPSVGAAPAMIAGMIAAEVSGLLTNTREPMAVPEILQFDARLRRMNRRKYRFGMRSPLQRLKRAIFARWLL